MADERVFALVLNVIDAGERIGHDADADRARYHLTELGIVVALMGQVRGDTNVYE